MTLIVVSATAAGIAEAGGLASLLPVLGQSNQSRDSLLFAIAVLGSLLVTSVLLRALADISVARLNVTIEYDLRRQFLQSLSNTPWKTLREVGSGDLVTALLSESSQISNGCTAYLTGLAAAIMAAALGATAIVVSPILALAALAFAAVSSRFYAKASRMSRGNQAKLAVASAQISDEAVSLLGGLKLLLSSGLREPWRLKMLARLHDLQGLRRRDMSIPILTRAMVEITGATMLVMMMAIAVVSAGNVTSALVLLALFYRMIPRLQTAQGSLLTARTQTAWIDRWSDRTRSWGSSLPTALTETTSTPAFQGLHLDSVTVRFPGREQAAVSGVDLELRPGRSLALIGHTGSGKTTIIDLVTGIVAPDEGRVLVNGRLIGELSLDLWQRSLGFVPQDAFVVSGTLVENVAWLDDTPDLDRVDECLQIAGLQDLLQLLPVGMMSRLGPRGASVSGGQRQRIALARALYRRPTVLILDEATSGLDPATESKVLDAVFAACESSAILMVTHRLDTIARADDVVLLDNGSVIARGTPSQVMNQNSPSYSRLLGRILQGGRT